MWSVQDRHSWRTLRKNRQTVSLWCELKICSCVHVINRECDGSNSYSSFARCRCYKGYDVKYEYMMNLDIFWRKKGTALTIMHIACQEPQEPPKKDPSWAQNRTRMAMFRLFLNPSSSFGANKASKRPWNVQFSNFYNFSGPKMGSKNCDFCSKKAFWNTYRMNECL